LTNAYDGQRLYNSEPYRISDNPARHLHLISWVSELSLKAHYNLRVYECKTAAWNMLAYQEQPLKTFDKTFLRDVPKETFEKTRDIMPACGLC
jgi:galactokinase